MSDRSVHMHSRGRHACACNTNFMPFTLAAICQIVS